MPDFFPPQAEAKLVHEQLAAESSPMHDLCSTSPARHGHGGALPRAARSRSGPQAAHPAQARTAPISRRPGGARLRACCGGRVEFALTSHGGQGAQRPPPGLSFSPPSSNPVLFAQDQRIVEMTRTTLLSPSSAPRSTSLPRRLVKRRSLRLHSVTGCFL